jgi:alpha-beta hydrolase superfamily lysophospholipase
MKASISKVNLYCSDTLQVGTRNVSISIHISRMYSSGDFLGGLIATFYSNSGTRRANIDAVILNSPYLASVELSPIESALIQILVRFNLSIYLDDCCYGRSLHVSQRGEWNFDVTKKSIEKVRLHGAFFSAVRMAQRDITKGNIHIPCPILLLCSNRSIKQDRQWRDEYAEGRACFFRRIYLSIDCSLQWI